MGNMDELAHPVRSYTRQDGRQLIATRRLDFRPVPLGRYRRMTQRALLVPGALFGAVVRYHWPELHERAALPPALKCRSARIHLQGTYNGDHLDVQVPVSRWHPQGPTETINAPLMDMKLWADAFTKINIGTMAVASLLCGETASLHYVDHPAVQAALGVTVSGAHMVAHIGKVQEGGLYYVPPLQR